MNRYKINYTTGNGEYPHQQIITARDEVSDKQAAATLIGQLAKQGVLAVLTAITQIK